jgi:DNA-binding LytR/AlgR family response regulator
MKALIIEDEAPAARRLQKMIYELDDSIEVISVLESVQESIAWFENNEHPDVIFSDIQLADGRSFDIYQQVEVECPIIFTTAYDEFAIKAFELNSVGYLLKPFSKTDLEKSILKLSKTGDSQFEMIDSLIKSLNPSGEYKSRFLINKGESLIPVSVEDISYIFTHDKLVTLITKSKDRFYLNQTLDEVEKQLDPKVFFRLNRQFVAQYSAIDRVENHFNGKLKVFLQPKSEEEIMVSRIKAPLFKNWLNQ